jgi:hypothetical protein
MVIHGKCHCANVSFQFTLDSAPQEIPARACGCTFCTKHGGVWTSSPNAALDVTVIDPAALSKYAFGTRTADFHVCARCGCVPLVTCEISGRTYAVVNVNCFEDVNPSLLRRTPASFDGEDVANRVARRQRNWISRVQFKSTAATQ